MIPHPNTIFVSLIMAACELCHLLCVQAFLSAPSALYVSCLACLSIKLRTWRELTRLQSVILIRETAIHSSSRLLQNGVFEVLGVGNMFDIRCCKIQDSG
jgi:hypothetical protein